MWFKKEKAGNPVQPEDPAQMTKQELEMREESLTVRETSLMRISRYGRSVMYAGNCLCVTGMICAGFFNVGTFYLTALSIFGPLFAIRGMARSDTAARQASDVRSAKIKIEAVLTPLRQQEKVLKRGFAIKAATRLTRNLPYKKSPFKKLHAGSARS